MRQNVTIMDIAAACDISKSTVANALNSRTREKVADDTLQKILAAAKKLGYRPNLAAKTLSSQKSHTIGVLLPSPENHFYASLSIALQKKFFARGYVSFFVYWERVSDAAKVMEAHDLLLSRGVDGIITCELDGVSFDSAVPTVMYGTGGGEGFDCVFFDGHTAAMKAVQLLLSAGHKRFAFIGPDLNTDKEQGYRDALCEAGLPLNPDWIYYGSFRDSAPKAMEKFLTLNRRPTAVLCSNDDLALTAMSEALRAGVKIPDEMAFVGCDDIEESRYCYPSLTTFRQSPDLIADSLLELLFRRIDAPNATIVHRKLEMPFIIRESTRL